MSIDRIGKGSGAPPAGPTSPAQKSAEPGPAFEVSRAAKPEAPAAVGPTSLEQLHAGKLDFEGYLSAKLHEATAHLQGIPQVQLDKIRSMLREQLSSDPALADMVQQATGRAPTPPED